MHGWQERIGGPRPAGRQHVPQQNARDDEEGTRRGGGHQEGENRYSSRGRGRRQCDERVDPAIGPAAIRGITKAYDGA